MCYTSCMSMIILPTNSDLFPPSYVYINIYIYVGGMPASTIDAGKSSTSSKPD